RRGGEVRVPETRATGAIGSDRVGDRKGATAEDKFGEFGQRLRETRANREARRRARRVDRPVRARLQVEKPTEPGDDQDVARIGGVAAVVRKQRLRRRFAGWARWGG